MQIASTHKHELATTGSIEVRPLTHSIGAEILNIRLRDLSGATKSQLYGAFLRHKVLFIRGQAGLTIEEHEDFASGFGECVAPPTIPVAKNSRFVLELDSRRGGRADAWHTDGAYTLHPDKATVLRSLTLPPLGGDTLWANTIAAYASLPAPLRGLVDQLWVQHSNDFDHAMPPPDKDSALAQLRSRIIRVEHPAVQIHPETNERALLLGNSMKRFVGMSKGDTEILYNLLQNHITRHDNLVRWRWEVGDVAIWDNRATQHFAINDYGDALRVMQRVSLRGDVPIGISGRQESRLLDY